MALIMNFANQSDVKTLENLRTMGGRVLRELKIEMQRQMLKNVAYAKRVKLTGGNPLHRRTGNLSRSTIAPPPDVVGFQVIGHFGVDGAASIYGRVHEFGAVIKRVSKKGKPFTATYPERSFLRSTMREREVEIVEGLASALQRGMLAKA